MNFREDPGPRRHATAHQAGGRSKSVETEAVNGAAAFAGTREGTGSAGGAGVRPAERMVDRSVFAVKQVCSL